MKTLLKRLVLFTIFTMSFFVVLYFLLTQILNSNAEFNFKSNKEILIIGHSHAERAYNDSIIPYTKNFASGAESYLYTLAKTRKLIEDNPQIKTVLIECSNDQFSDKMDNWIFGERMSNRLYVYAPFLNFDESKMLFLKNPKIFIEAAGVFFRKSFAKIVSSDYNYTDEVGGYNWNDLILKSAPSYNEVVPDEYEISEANITYLKHIISYLKSKKIRPILIRTPTLKNYYNYYSEIQYQRILQAQFNEIEYLDFSQYQMEYFNYGDFVHMNHVGAKKYSKWFAMLLRNGLLEKDNKQVYIDSEIKNLMRK